MNNKRSATVILRVFLFSYCLFFFVALPSAARAVNPSSATSDFSLPMPGGEDMVFRPVFIGEGDKPFALREFKVGDQTGGYKEFPTHATIGGAFKKQNASGVMDWMYFIGKYEVTEKQYFAIMDPAKKTDSKKPITNISWFEAIEFINKYNLWLYENAEQKLPRHGELPGFLRLPTEMEWEFAARGGTAVDQMTFQGKTPYSERLSKHEWFAGPKSSHGKIKNVGMLKSNPLKLHDMLGNVSEMTGTQYMVEYYQGRNGGFVCKGGNFTTSKEQIHSSMRNEIPYYKKKRGKMAATTQPVLGFRLIIAAPIFSSMAASQELKLSWPEYAASRNPPGGGRVQIEKLIEQVALLEGELVKEKQNKSTPLNVAGVVGQIKSLIQGVRAKQGYKDKNAAFSWVKVANDTALMVWQRDIKEINTKKKALPPARRLGRSDLIDKINKQIKDMEANIRSLTGTVSMAFEQLNALDEASVVEGYEKYTTFLRTNNTGNFNPDSQIRMVRLLEKHYKMFRNRGKLDGDKLLQDITNFKGY